MMSVVQNAAGEWFNNNGNIPVNTLAIKYNIPEQRLRALIERSLEKSTAIISMEKEDRKELGEYLTEMYYSKYPERRTGETYFIINSHE